MFAISDIERITGVKGLLPRPSTRPIEQGVGECQLTKGDGPDRLIEVAAAVDCRPIHPRLESIRKVAQSQPGFKEESVGVGGVYTNDPAIEMHRLVFVSEQPSCAVYVSTVKVETNVTRSLARPRGGAHQEGRPNGPASPGPHLTRASPGPHLTRA